MQANVAEILIERKLVESKTCCPVPTGVPHWSGCTSRATVLVTIHPRHRIAALGGVTRLHVSPICSVGFSWGEPMPCCLPKIVPACPEGNHRVSKQNREWAVPEQGHGGRAAKAMACSGVELLRVSGITRAAQQKQLCGLSHALLPPSHTTHPIAGTFDGTIVTAEKMKKVKLERRKGGVSYKVSRCLCSFFS